MALGFLGKKAGRRKSVPEAPEFRGPLDLAPGDVVDYYQTSYKVEGVLILDVDVSRRHQYLLKGEDGSTALISAATGEDAMLSLQTLPGQDDDVAAGPTNARVNGDDHELREQGTAVAWGLGDVPTDKYGEMEFRYYVDDEEDSIVCVEEWNDLSETRLGTFIYESELKVHHMGEITWEIKAPPKLDLRSVNEALHAEERKAIAAEEERHQAELMAAREKLTEFADWVAQRVVQDDDVEDVVPLCEIVDKSALTEDDFSLGFAEPVEDEEEPAPPPEV